MENLGSDCPLGRPHSDRLGRVSIAFHTLPCVRGQPLARIVDEQLVARHVVLPHHWRQSLLEAAQEVTKSRIAVTFWPGLTVLI